MVLSAVACLGICWLIMVHYWPGVGIVRGTARGLFLSGRGKNWDYKITFFLNIKTYNLVDYGLGS
jgi:hypothetical protein